MRAIVSGTAGGIGRAITLKFLEEGWEVTGYDLLPSSIDDPRYTHVIHDIRKPLSAPVPDAEVLVVNAGTLEEADAIDVNLLGSITFYEAFENAPSLKSVLFIASASARNGAEFPRYVASKAGLVGYMKNRALALSSRGITCNSISPGGVITSANKHILEDEKLYAAVLKETMLGKWAETSEVADLAWYLTAVNRSITGEDILMDNGEMLKSHFIW